MRQLPEAYNGGGGARLSLIGTVPISCKATRTSSILVHTRVSTRQCFECGVIGTVRVQSRVNSTSSSEQALGFQRKVLLVLKYYNYRQQYSMRHISCQVVRADHPSTFGFDLCGSSRHSTCFKTTTETKVRPSNEICHTMIPSLHKPALYIPARQSRRKTLALCNPHYFATAILVALQYS